MTETNPSTPVTSGDVARHAKVSQSAVSRAFTPGASISQKMREKILKSAAELGYRPNALARAMISGKSGLIAMLVAYLDNQFYPLALERLSPLERAAFLLHDVFAVPFEEVAATLGREPAACRQLAARARRHVEAARPRFKVLPAEHEALAMAFHDASRSGDTATLATLLAEEVVLVSDGGGVRSAALRPLG